ncbi:prephenate dehydrogenase [Sansalvadorimonas verongulae]|uniref:prephenate dehydrogenase n=1 Tax=Sansalvadorimonas verongulae TaxID=2172824 RepID=UPI0012BD6488|nr:prephenate dehydrogenase [Sansalvadorimonas verongulae]MTI12775.1 prephenate dehydrogenase [Sansalvadorimonas verongulae]
MPHTETGISQSTREAVVNKITDSLKALYPLAQSADEQLDMLKKQNKGKFSAIFLKGSPFTAESDRFLPYMVEVAHELAELAKVDDKLYVKHLNQLMHKVQLMHEVLTKFHSIKDEEKATPQAPAPQAVH